MNLSAIPSEIWEAGEITKLDLSRNSIQELPPELSSCASLQVKFSDLVTNKESCISGCYLYWNL